MEFVTNIVNFIMGLVGYITDLIDYIRAKNDGDEDAEMPVFNF